MFLNRSEPLISIVPYVIMNNVIPFHAVEGLELARNRVASDSCALTHEDHLQGKKGGHHLALWQQGASDILTMNLQAWCLSHRTRVAMCLVSCCHLPSVHKKPWFETSTYANPKITCYPNARKFDFFLLVVEIYCKKTETMVAKQVCFFNVEFLKYRLLLAKYQANPYHLYDKSHSNKTTTWEDHVSKPTAASKASIHVT